METKFKKNYEKVKILIKKVVIYLIVITTGVSSFLVGYYYNNIMNFAKPRNEISKIKKNEVNLAIDQNGNLVIFDTKTGKYTIYEYSVGNTIFSLYAKNVWGQHTQINP